MGKREGKFLNAIFYRPGEEGGEERRRKRRKEEVLNCDLCNGCEGHESEV